jgi:hypothetical protein
VDLSQLHEWTGVVNDAVVSVAALAGGAWAILRLKRERSDEAALDIDVSHTSYPQSDQCFVFFRVVLRNVGKTKIQAKTESSGGFIYDDGVEQLKHGCSLQLKRIKPWAAGTHRRLDWFDSPLLEAVEGLGEINLLADYEDPKQDNSVDFWMEPSETYDLGTPLMLSGGTYLAKVTVVASGDDGNYWTSITELIIPAAQAAVSGQENAPPVRADLKSVG